MAVEEWQDLLLEEIAADVTVGYVGPMATEYVAEGIPFLRSQNVEPLRINDSELKFITPEFHERLRKSALSPGDVVIVRTGKPGACAVIPFSLPVANCSDLVIVRCGPRLDPQFLAYYVNSVAAHHVDSHLVGAVQQHFNIGSARKILVHLPSVAHQRAIAQVLSTLDDKIELNRRMNETLEAIARALFKSWFVDFDPVRAKAEGRDTRLAQHVADLFPDSFVDSELGEIPKGWRIQTVNHIAKINARTLGNGDSLDFLDYIEISEVIRGEIGTVQKYERGTEPSRARRRLTHGDSVLSTVRPDRGAHFLCLNPPETLIASTGFAVLSPRDANWAFLYSAVTRPEIGDELGRLADGGAYPAIRPEVIGSRSLVIPSQSGIVAAFQRLAGPLFNRTRVARTEAKTIAALRDTLLPKLISGELRVSDAQQVIRMATP
jgi:type I restriction enzyme S subunit